MTYNRYTHGDFMCWYDATLKRNYWLLGYFGGGSVNVCDIMELALDMSNTLNIPIQSIYVDEILYSSRYKHFKFLSSNVEQTPMEGAIISDNAWSRLTN